MHGACKRRCYRGDVNPIPASLPAGTARPLTEFPALAERAADLLRTPNAMLQLGPEEAATVVGLMRLVGFERGTVLFREGDRGASSYMLLVLDGEVSVDAGDAATGDGVAISVLGTGSILGEMALLDGAPRSVSCTALTPIQAAGLSRAGLQLLIDEHPRVAAKLLIGLAKRISDRLRALGDQLQLYAQLVATQSQELDRLRPGGDTRR